MGQDNKKRKKFKIESQDSSGLSAFVKRPVPSQTELENFENVLGKEIKHQEIDANLNEIYSDKQGDLVDVKKMKIRQRSQWIIRVFHKLMFLILLSLTAYFLYIYFFTGDTNLESVNFKIQAPQEIQAGQEFSYYITISNDTKFSISDINLELNYPVNYVFHSANVSSEEYNNSFDLDSIAAGGEKLVEIKGMIIAPEQTVAVVSAHLKYTPVNFSSQFKKESSAASVISGFGFKLDIDYPSLVFIGQSNDITLSFSDYSNSFLQDFIVEFSPAKGKTISLAESKDNNANDKLNVEGPNTWSLDLNDLADKNISFKYLAKDETDTDASLGLTLKKRLDNGENYIFAKYDLKIEAVKSDLNISLFLDDSKNNQAVNFGQTLNYSLKYNNNGDSSYKDAVITVVLNGKLYDLSSLQSDIKPDLRSSQIIWDKQKINALAEIKPGDEGEIKFSIDLLDYNSNIQAKDMEVSAYCQYGGESGDESTSNKSNTIVSVLNTNLKLKEEIRYFDKDNLPVGSGPLPPKVGEETSFRVYWDIENSLHEIKNTLVSVNLPSYVDYKSTSLVSVGSLYYLEDGHQVIWDLGKLPISINNTSASFNISLKPTENDRNKILVLLPGASVSAFDTATKEDISDSSGAKTTKLEDDDIAALSNSGRIE